MWFKLAVLFFLLVAIALIGSAWYGASVWRFEANDLRTQLDRPWPSVSPARFDKSMLAGLPPPVQRYLDMVLPDGQPMISAVAIAHSGTFCIDTARSRWLSFRSDQRVATVPPGFDWQAQLRLAPGIEILVQDAYIDGEGILRASLMGLRTLAARRGGDDLARGELMRYLAEAAYYPTALLPQAGVRWTPIDDTAARASLADGDLSVTLVFRFGTDGLIEAVEAADRARALGDRLEPTPWRGRFARYADHGGILIPVDGEVAWVADGREQPYWRGRLESIEYRFA